MESILDLMSLEGFSVNEGKTQTGALYHIAMTVEEAAMRIARLGSTLFCLQIPETDPHLTPIL